MVRILIGIVLLVIALFITKIVMDKVYDRFGPLPGDVPLWNKNSKYSFSISGSLVLTALHWALRMLIRR